MIVHPMVASARAACEARTPQQPIEFFEPDIASARSEGSDFRPQVIVH